MTDLALIMQNLWWNLRKCLTHVPVKSPGKEVDSWPSCAIVYMAVGTRELVDYMKAVHMGDSNFVTSAHTGFLNHCSLISLEVFNRFYYTKMNLQGYCLKFVIFCNRK